MAAGCFAVVVYTAVNFAVFINLMEGTPEVKNGRYYLHHHGQIIREITEVEYGRFRAYEVRGFSGHWMLFSLLPMVFFGYIVPEFRKLGTTPKGSLTVA